METNSTGAPAEVVSAITFAVTNWTKANAPDVHVVASTVAPSRINLTINGELIASMEREELINAIEMAQS